jgi:guanine nucleotide-binding protein subunit alpha
MGCTQSAEDKAAQQRNKELDQVIKQEKEKLKSEVKLLLLGAGESGKSTIVKQMKIIHEDGFSEVERESYREIVFGNTIHAMQSLLNGMDSLGISFDDTRLQVGGSVLDKFVLPSQLRKHKRFTNIYGALLSKI